MPRARRRRRPLLPLLLQLANSRGRTFNATAWLERSKRELTRTQLLPTGRWVRYQDAGTSVLVQIGANNHEQSSSFDPGPICVKRGWRSVLIEPVPQIFAALQRHYKNATTARVQLLNAAVCAPTAGSESSGSCKSQRSQRIWYIDTTNATGNYGTNHSDARCILNSGLYGFLTEIASLRKSTVLQNNRLLQHSRSSERRCAACSAALGRPLPGDCVRDMINANLRSHDARCLCLAEELKLQTNTHNPLKSERSVTLLAIDAEGFDLEILRQWPFDVLPTARVSFEAAHLSDANFEAAAALLEGKGFRYVSGGYGAYLSEWQHVKYGT